MPLILGVGLCRNASKDYQSAGISINVTAELDQALLTRPSSPLPVMPVPTPRMRRSRLSAWHWTT